VAVALALAFVAIGFVEYATKTLFWNPKVIASNQFETYFRVNSLFFDPNIYGRFLAIVMTALAALVVWSGRWTGLLGATAALAVLLAGLVLTFSQSSLAALLLSLIVLAALRWPARLVVGAAGVAAVAAVIAAIAFPGVAKVDIGNGRSLDQTTSGRVDLIKGGVRMFTDRPFQGFGSGSFAERFREREKVSEQRAASASHTIPVTIAAEQGIPGLLAYLFVLVAAFSLLFGRLQGLRHPTPTPDLVAHGAIAAAFAGLVLHTWAYAAFLEDPLTWTLLGVALGLRASSSASGPSPAERSAARTRTRSSTS
jgi:O-antigen ligase